MSLNAVAILAACFVLATTAEAKGGGGSRPSYSGSKHTNSHDGHYAGSSGSSHKGGTYRNHSSNDRYGTHAGSGSGARKSEGSNK